MPDECLRALADADAAIHAGDVTTGEVLELLRTLAPVEAVHRNMDDAALRAELPERTVVEVEGVRIGVVHDAGRAAARAERLVTAFPGCAAVVYGHTHVPEVTQHEGVWILNPGSPTERRRAPARSFLVCAVLEGELRPRLVELA